MSAHPPPGSKTELYRFAGVGMQFAASIAVFALGGHWLDGRLGSGPWLLITGVFLGFGLGLVSLIAKTTPKEHRRKRTPPVPPDDVPPSKDPR